MKLKEKIGSCYEVKEIFREFLTFLEICGIISLVAKNFKKMLIT